MPYRCFLHPIFFNSWELLTDIGLSWVLREKESTQGVFPILFVVLVCPGAGMGPILTNFGSKGVEVPAWLERNTHNIYSNHYFSGYFPLYRVVGLKAFGGGDFENVFFFSILYYELLMAPWMMAISCAVIYQGLFNGPVIKHGTTKTPNAPDSIWKMFFFLPTFRY